MRLVRAIKAAVYDLLAIDGGACVWEALKGDKSRYGDRHADEMWAFLRWVTKNGPPRHNPKRSKHLRNDIYEFKQGPLRILWFWHPKPTKGRIVLTHLAPRKKQRKADPDEIDYAERVESQFLAARATNLVETVERLER